MPLNSNPAIKLNIIYEDKDVIVINKPAGLLVHPIKSSQNDTLVNALLYYYPAIKNVGEDSRRPGIVHRLDKDTSGLMVTAKNNRAFEYLKKQFAANAESFYGTAREKTHPLTDRKIEKHYLALVIGRVKEKKGTITKAISYSKKGRQKRSALLDKKSKSARTEYRVLRYFKDYTLLDIIPQTGRTHQIRVHLASIGHPIAGDKEYKFKRQPFISGLNRQFLHAFSLKFYLLSGKVVKFKSRLPKDLKTVLAKLKNNN